MKMLVDKDWLQEKIASDPDADADAGRHHPDLLDTSIPGPAVDLCPDCEGQGDDGDPLWPHVCQTCNGRGFLGAEPEWPEDGDYHQYIWGSET